MEGGRKEGRKRGRVVNGEQRRKKRQYKERGGRGRD